MPSVGTAVDIEGGAWAIIFAGGIGSRFWPLSSPRRPKPALQLLSEKPLLLDTIERLAPLVLPERILVVTSRDIAPEITRAAPEIPRENVLVEPRPLGTAAALAWGLHSIRERGGNNAAVCALHADLTAAFPAEFRRRIKQGMALAVKERALVTFGVSPTRPETAFGYLVPGDPIDAAAPVQNGGPGRVSRFVEKPELDGVVELLTQGALWHAGIVVGRASDMNEELFRHTTELARGRESLGRGNLNEFAVKIQSVSIERGLLQRSDKLLVLPLDCGWDDVGTWACLRRARELDDAGNGAIGEAYFVDSSSNIVHTESGTVVLFGCQKMLVVTLNGITFVTPLDKAADLRPLLEQLPSDIRKDPTL
jgi:mannose-1-phosphate guanylyltransferase